MEVTWIDRSCGTKGDAGGAHAIVRPRPGDVDGSRARAHLCRRPSRRSSGGSRPGRRSGGALAAHFAGGALPIVLLWRLTQAEALGVVHFGARVAANLPRGRGRRVRAVSRSRPRCCFRQCRGTLTRTVRLRGQERARRSHVRVACFPRTQSASGPRQHAAACALYSLHLAPDTMHLTPRIQLSRSPACRPGCTRHSSRRIHRPPSPPPQRCPRVPAGHVSRPLTADAPAEDGAGGGSE